MKKIIGILLIFLFVFQIGALWAESETDHEAGSLSVYLVIPFVLMLLSIAVIPLKWEHWWEDNNNKLIVSSVLGIPIGIYFLFFDYHELLHILEEYVAFIIYVGSLFVISGGDCIAGRYKGFTKSEYRNHCHRSVSCFFYRNSRCKHATDTSVTPH